ncbi:MAG: translocation/assembly module TamB domain-containing protein [Phormidesmis sp.]
MPPTPDDSPSPLPPSSPNDRRFSWFWLGILTGSVLGAAGLGLAAWAWMFIYDDLAPLLSKTLTESLDRPVELGDVEKVTLGSLRVGPSEMGPSDTDPTTLSVETVTVKFDLLDTLLTRKLGLDLILVGAEGYIEQDKEKGWLNFSGFERDEDQPQRFKVSVNDVRIRDSELTLVPLPAAAGQPRPIPIDQVRGNINLEEVMVAGEEARHTRFEIQGEPAAGGEITVKGEVQPVVVSAALLEETAEDTETNGPDDAIDSPSGADLNGGDRIGNATNLLISGDKAPLADILSFTLSTIGIPTNDVTVAAGQVSGTLDMKFRPGQPLDYSGALIADNAEIKTTLLPLPLKDMSGQTRFQGNEWTIDRLSADYGKIEAVAEGLVDFDEGYDLTVVAKDVSVEDFTETVKLKLPVPTAGRFDAIAQVGGPLRQPEFSGTVTAITPIEVDKLTFTSASSDFFLEGRQLLLDDIAATPNTGGALRGSGQVRLGEGSPFTFQLAGRSLPARELAKLYGVETPFKIGLVSADAVVTGGNDGPVNTTVQLDAPSAQYPASGVVEISGRTVAFRDTTLQVGGGTVSGSGQLVNGQWNSDVTLAGVQLSTLSDNLRGDISGQFALSGNTADNRLAAIAARGNVAFSDGLATFAPQFSEFDDPLTARVAWNGEQITVDQATTDRVTASGTLTPEFSDSGFTGLERLDLDVTARDYAIAEIPFVSLPDAIALTGRTDFTGTISGNPTAPTISGNVQLANLVINRLPFNPLLTGSVAYSSDSGLALDVAGGSDRIALNLRPSGPQGTLASTGSTPNLDFDIDWRDTFARGQTQGELLNVQAGNFPLSVLNFPAGGAADIGQLRGTLTTADLAINLGNQTLEGDFAIDQLGLGYINAGQLTGQIRYADSLATLTSGALTIGDNLYDLSGRLALGGGAPVYSANITTQQGDVQNLLTALSIYQLEDLRRGLTPPDWIENPLSQTELETLLATSQTGRADAALLNQLRRLAEIEAIQSEIAIAEAAAPLPPLKELSGPFAGEIQLNGQGSDFQLDFDLAGANWQWGQDYSADQVIAQGSLTPNVLTLAPVRFASTILVPIDPTAAPAAAETELAATMPESPANSEGTPLSDLAVRPVEAAVNFAGQLVFGQNTELTSNLQATAQNLNVDTLSDVLELPINIDGFANASATLGGTLNNPQLRGRADLANAAINDTPIQSASAQFLYQNARLSLDSALVATTPEEPLTLRAQIPYAFNFMTVEPESDDIAVEIDVRDEGLALLNIFTQQVAWESGQGQVNLKIGGTLSNPEIAGFATLDEAVLSAKILPEPLTNVNGRATFVGDRIIVETLQGSFSDGQLTAAGTFPLLSPIISGAQLTALTAAPNLPPESPTDAAEPAPNADPSREFDPLFPQPLAPSRPLTVNFENIALSLQDLYEGGVNGQVIVGGSALVVGPQIAGEVVLSNGQVLLPDGNGSGGTTTLASTPTTGTTGTTSTTTGGLTPDFRDLRLTLGNSVRIIQGNLLNFVADGTLVLNGPPSDLEPAGVINLRSGRVSLFTTLFRLRGGNNTAEFRPELGLQNPLLDVSLRASVPEVNSAGPIASTPFASSEVADTSNNGFDNPGSLRTIRVRADVDGPANAIFENLELSSSPSRSEAELIGLIGGGFITALESTVGSLSGSGDGFQGLINLVSGTVLTSVQDLIGTTLSLSEFRLFPVTAASRTVTEGTKDTGLDIGAEIGFDVTDTTSLSVSKILTDNTNPEFGINYRLSDQFTVRGTTDLDEINQVLLEYEIRF